MEDLSVKGSTIKDRFMKVEEQFRSWDITAASAAGRKAKHKGFSFVTISRQYGCAGFRIGDNVAENMNARQKKSEAGTPWTVYDQRLVDMICEDHNLNRNLVETLDRQRKHVFGDYITGIFTGEPSSIKVFKKCAATIFSLASRGHVILIGRASSLITEKVPGGLHVRIVAPFDWRVKQVAHYEKIDTISEARPYVEKMDAERENFARDFLGRSVAEPEAYHMVLNQEKLGVEGIVKIIMDFA